MEYYSSLDASQLDSETPTLFELISSNQLESLLSPSLRYILVHYASRYPRYLLRLNNNFDEINLALRSFVEWYFIKYWQGSFTENFYGIKRVNQTPLSNGNFNSKKLNLLVPSMIEDRRTLSSLQSIVSIFEITGTSYLSEKLNYCYEIWYTKSITNQLNSYEGLSKQEELKLKFKRTFVKVYPYIQSVVSAGNFITTLLYLSGSSKSPSLLTYIFKINYSRLNQYDHSKHEPSPKSPKTRPNRIAPETTIQYLVRFITRNFTRPSWKVLKLVLGTFFPIAIFSLKFLEWWNNSDFSSKLSKNQGNVLDFTLPPPSTLAKALQDNRLQNKSKRVYKSANVCPLCKEEISNPAIIETGYVFDYACIYNYLEKSHIIVSEKMKLRDEDEGDDEGEDEEEDEEEDGEEEDGEPVEKRLEIPVIDINKGGRCPITGKKLLGCKWNSIKEEWEIEGIRRIIF